MSESLTGQLLVASSLVTDPVHAGCVCLVVHDDGDNVIAVMLNRPMQPSPEAMMAMLRGLEQSSEDETSAGEQEQMPAPDDSFDEQALEEQPSDQPLPLEPTNRIAKFAAAELTSADECESHGALHFGGPLSGPVVAIHQTSQYAEAETGVGIYVAAQKKILENLIRDVETPYRLIVGHLGWESNQLDAEIDAGLWHVVPATAERVFSSAGEMWPRLILRATSCSMAKWMGVPDLEAAGELN